MITVKLKIGNSTVSGPTFSVADRVDYIHARLLTRGNNSGIIHMWYKNNSEKGVFFGTVTEDFTTGLTLSLILQSDNATEIDAGGENGPTGCGIKDVTVELLP